MNDLARRVRRAIDEHAAPDGLGPAHADQALRAGRRARTTRRVAGATAAVAVLAVGVLVVPQLVPTRTAVPAGNPVTGPQTTTEVSTGTTPHPDGGSVAPFETPTPDATPAASASPSPEPIPTAPPATPPTQAEDEARALALAAFARDPASVPVATFDPADRVLLGAGQEFFVEQPVNALGSSAGWSVGGTSDRHGALTGPFNAVDLLSAHLRRNDDRLDSLVVGSAPYRICGDRGRSTQAPASVADLHRVTLQPVDGSYGTCEEWFSVDLYVTPESTVRAVVVNLGQP